VIEEGLFIDGLPACISGQEHSAKITRLSNVRLRPAAAGAPLYTRPQSVETKKKQKTWQASEWTGIELLFIFACGNQKKNKKKQGTYVRSAKYIAPSMECSVTAEGAEPESMHTAKKGP
jgi:hypothetical protein